MDLNAPLGMMPPPKPRRRAGLILSVGLIALLCIAAGLVLVLSDPHAGEPSAVAIIPPEPPVVGRTGDVALAGIMPRPSRVDREPRRDTIIDPTPTASLPVGRPSADDAPSLEHGVKVFRSPSPGTATVAATGPLVIDVSHALDEPQRKPGAVPPDAPTMAANSPKIAIFVSGMGLDEGATRTAIEVMPSAVGLAFLPYGNALGSLVDAAKARGHEVLLQLPMQNRGGEASGPAKRPHGLTIERAGSAMKEDLDWLFARVRGYDGVTNLLGAAVSSNTSAMTAVLSAVGGRHLFYLDDGTSKRSQAISVGATLGVPAMQTDLVLDATTDPVAVRANLQALVAIARRKGMAIGMASGLPDHVAAIARFASELRGQGISLVPVNALVGASAIAPPAIVAR